MQLMITKLDALRVVNVGYRGNVLNHGAKNNDADHFRRNVFPTATSAWYRCVYDFWVCLYTGSTIVVGRNNNNSVLQKRSLGSKRR